jgi:hypothetical protein
MPGERTTSTILRLSTLGAGLAAGWLVHKVLDSVWQRTAGHPSPSPDDRDQPLAEVVLATALTGALVALLRALAQRGTARFLHT